MSNKKEKLHIYASEVSAICGRHQYKKQQDAIIDMLKKSRNTKLVRDTYKDVIGKKTWSSKKDDNIIYEEFKKKCPTLTDELSNEKTFTNKPFTLLRNKPEACVTPTPSKPLIVDTQVQSSTEKVLTPVEVQVSTEKVLDKITISDIIESNSQIIAEREVSIQVETTAQENEMVTLFKKLAVKEESKKELAQFTSSKEVTNAIVHGLQMEVGTNVESSILDAYREDHDISTKNLSVIKEYDNFIIVGKVDAYNLSEDGDITGVVEAKTRMNANFSRDKLLYTGYDVDQLAVYCEITGYNKHNTLLQGHKGDELEIEIQDFDGEELNERWLEMKEELDAIAKSFFSRKNHTINKWIKSL